MLAAKLKPKAGARGLRVARGGERSWVLAMPKQGLGFGVQLLLVVRRQLQGGEEARSVGNAPPAPSPCPAATRTLPRAAPPLLLAPSCPCSSNVTALSHPQQRYLHPPSILQHPRGSIRRFLSSLLRTEVRSVLCRLPGAGRGEGVLRGAAGGGWRHFMFKKSLQRDAINLALCHRPSCAAPEHHFVSLGVGLGCALSQAASPCRPCATSLCHEEPSGLEKCHQTPWGREGKRGRDLHPRRKRRGSSCTPTLPRGSTHLTRAGSSGLEEM